MESSHELTWFFEVFDAELEHRFSLDIACCDSCHDKFVALWPRLSSSPQGERTLCRVDLNEFYRRSRIPGLYSQAEYDEYVNNIACPRCKEQLGAAMWVYEFPFDVDPSFETHIAEIAHLAKRTPFLILTHDYAQRVHKTLCEIGSTLIPTTLPNTLWRARKYDKVSSIPEDIVEFSFPSPDIVKEGRYNHAGNPVLYLSSDLRTSVEEVGRSACLAGELCFHTPLTILDLVNPVESHRGYSDELESLAYSALLSAKQPDMGWHKPHYVFSRFISDCARSAGIQAIKYHSTRYTTDNYNLVIVDPTLRLGEVAKLKKCVHVPQGGLGENEYSTFTLERMRSNVKLLLESIEHDKDNVRILREVISSPVYGGHSDEIREGLEFKMSCVEDRISLNRYSVEKIEDSIGQIERALREQIAGGHTYGMADHLSAL